MIDRNTNAWWVCIPPEEQEQVFKCIWILITYHNENELHSTREVINTSPNSEFPGARIDKCASNMGVN